MTDLRQEYLFEGGDNGCLVIHGFTSNPAEVYELGRRIHEAGFTVLGVKLKGHGTDVADFARSTEADWIASACDGFERLRKRCKTVCVAGHSMGGLLAMHLAERYEVAKLILLAPAVVYRNWYISFANIARYFMKEYTWPKEERSGEEMKYLQQYKSFPMVNVHYMTRLQRKVRRGLADIKAPTLLVVARNDTLVHVRTARVLEQGMSKPPTVLWLEKSGHSVVVDCEKETVFAACVKFLKE